MVRLLFTVCLFIAAAAPAVAGSYVVCDNGLDCVTEPCPNITVIDLTNNQIISGIRVDLSGLSPRDRAQVVQAQATYYGTLVLGGSIESRSINVGGATEIRPHFVVAAIERDATPEESRRCRSKGPFDGK